MQLITITHTALGEWGLVGHLAWRLKRSATPFIDPTLINMHFTLRRPLELI